MASTRLADTPVIWLGIVLTRLPISVHLPLGASISQHGVDAASCLSKCLLDQNDGFNFGQFVEPEFLQLGSRR
ncbi:hypothetical protein ARMGADRAFT_1018725 [Armillaria gallica]|uniref:Uncharacterized protein n=1 Tax=Armillaria gallica TaxID=47427 RepID=A0A2H3CLW2_ARMGA|nr:hypothetical protein ARMGADRAFT_1018725 [Armillaria gallica]